MPATIRDTTRKRRCVRCYHPRPAVTVLALAFGGAEYRLPLCDEHVDLAHTQIFAWTRLGVVESPASPVERIVGPLPRVPIPRPISVEEEPEEEAPPPWLESLPKGVRDALADIPGVQDWALSRRARERAGEARIDLLTVLMAAEAPHEVTPSTEDPSILLHRRGDVTAVVCPDNKTVLTCFRLKEERRGHKAS